MLAPILQRTAHGEGGPLALDRQHNRLVAFADDPLGQHIGTAKGPAGLAHRTGASRWRPAAQQLQEVLLALGMGAHLEANGGQAGAQIVRRLVSLPVGNDLAARDPVEVLELDQAAEIRPRLVTGHGHHAKGRADE